MKTVTLTHKVLLVNPVVMLYSTFLSMTVDVIDNYNVDFGD